MSSERTLIASSVPPGGPTTSSVDPPPMSTMSSSEPLAAPSTGRSDVAPRNESLPSSSPERSSGSTPVTSSAAERNSREFDASRAAEVATIRARTTLFLSMLCRYSRRTSSVLSIASAESLRLVSTPWPSRVDAHLAIHELALGPDDQKAGRVRTAVERCDRPASVRHPDHSPVSNPSRFAVQRPTGSSPPARYQARWAWRHLTPLRVPPTPPVGLGPWWSIQSAASRSAA